MMIKAIIFDMDGLLIDSEMISYKCYRDFLKEYNLSFTLEDYIKDYPGRTLVKSLNFIKEHYHLDFNLEDGVQIFRNLEDYHVQKDGVPLKEGALELLNYLKENNYKTIVATSSRKERALDLLNKLHVLTYFNDFVFGTEVEHSKPAPDIFLKACEKLDVLPTEALILEDSEAGIDSAFQANIPVICIPDLKNPDAIHKEKTACLLKALDEVIDYIEKSNA